MINFYNQAVGALEVWWTFQRVLADKELTPDLKVMAVKDLITSLPPPQLSGSARQTFTFIQGRLQAYVDNYTAQETASDPEEVHTASPGDPQRGAESPVGDTGVPGEGTRRASREDGKKTRRT